MRTYTGASGTKEHGIAIVMALIVVALAGVLAAMMLGGADVDIGALEGRQNHAQADLLAAGGVDYARAVLAEDFRRTSYDALNEPWATPLPEFKTEVGSISGAIEERQGCFNLNNLINDDNKTQRLPAVAAYRRLLALLTLPDALADALLLWMDFEPQAAGGVARAAGVSNALPTVAASALTAAPAPAASMAMSVGVGGDGSTAPAAPATLAPATPATIAPATSAPPATSTPPSPASDASDTRLPPRRLADLANLRSIAGYDKDTFARLQPYVCALPSPGATALNVNTAAPEVLAAVVPGLALNEAQRMTQLRKTVPWRNTGDFSAQLPERAKFKDAALSLDVRSQFFLLRVTARVERAKAQRTVLVNRSSTAWPLPVWQTLQ